MKRELSGASVCVLPLVTIKRGDEEVGAQGVLMRQISGVAPRVVHTWRSGYCMQTLRPLRRGEWSWRRAEHALATHVWQFSERVMKGVFPEACDDPRFDPLATLDMLIELQKIINHRLSLDSIATTTLGVEKTAEGLQAIEWFRAGRLMEIAEYCCYDVKITKLVHEYGNAYKQLFYKNRFGTKLSVNVSW